MSEIETRYARAGDVNIAYQVVGDGPINVVFVPGMISHVEFSWELPGYAQLLNGLARWARVAVFDKRGNGLSDAVAQVPGVDERMDDIRTVMDAVGMDHAALFGVSEGAALGLLFAATFPARVDQVAGLGGFAYMYATEGYPYGFDPGEFDYPGFVDELTELWGSGVSIDVCALSLADDAQARAQCVPCSGVVGRFR